jgi:hypothetical protein
MSILISGESDNFPVKRNNFEEIWGSHGSENVHGGLVCCDAVDL